MILFIAILLIILGILSLSCAIYTIYCILGARAFDNKVKDEGIKSVDKYGKLNLLIYIIKKSASVKDATYKNIKQTVHKKVVLYSNIALTFIVMFMYFTFFCITTGLNVFNIDRQMVTTATLIQSIFMKDDDCLCYAECTGKKEIDEKCVYELLFGPAEYKKLITHMEKTLPYADIEYFKELDSGKDGKAKSDFIKARINDEMVEDYKAIVGSNSKFRKDDGKDRSKMSFDELKADLSSLLSDYKVKGRNPNCDCSTCSLSKLDFRCMGMKHYREGWSWEALWEEFDTSSPSGSTSANTPGNATGTFALQLDGGSFYWYHQSSEKCAYNAYRDEYGYIGSCRAGGVSNGTMSARGCGIYSTAMALSNILGEEITPWEVITEVMRCEIKKSSSGTVYFDSNASNGISYSGNSVVMSMPTLANLINEAYGSKGVVAEVVPFNQESIDSYLFSDDVYAYCINSYRSANNFTWYKGDGHFMVLRPGSEKGKYKCFTSASTLYGSGHSNIEKGMNDELSWNLVKTAGKHPQCVMISRSKSYYTTGTQDSTNGGTVGYNKEVYDILVQNSKYSPKALALASIYASLEPEYGRSFAIGMMANIYAEGNFGIIEGIWTSNSASGSRNSQLTCSCHSGKWSYSYWSKVSGGVHAKCTEEGNGATRVNADRVEYLLNNIPAGTPGIGIGTVQWSGDRRTRLLETYKESCTTYSQDELAVAEVLFMKKELQPDYSNGYYYRLVVKASNGKSASECARIICAKYEAPAAGSTAQNTRAAYASELESLLASVTTSGATNGSSADSSNSSADSSNSSAASNGEAVVEYAKQFLGNHYKWGGVNPNVSDWKNNQEHLKYANESTGKSCTIDGADCSGFVLAVYKHFGQNLPHSSSSLASVGTKVSNPSESNMKPGDIICYSGHVAIYIGDGKIIHASSHVNGIIISDKWNYNTVVAVRRIFD